MRLRGPETSAPFHPMTNQNRPAQERGYQIFLAIHDQATIYHQILDHSMTLASVSDVLVLRDFLWGKTEENARAYGLAEILSYEALQPGCRTPYLGASLENQQPLPQ